MSYKRCQNDKAIVYVTKYYLNIYFVSKSPISVECNVFDFQKCALYLSIFSNSFFDRLVFHSSYLLFTQYYGLSNSNDRFINIISFMNSVLHLITKRSRGKKYNQKIQQYEDVVDGWKKSCIYLRHNIFMLYLFLYTMLKAFEVRAFILFKGKPQIPR